MSSSPNQEQITLNLSWKCSLSCYSHTAPRPPPFLSFIFRQLDFLIMFLQPDSPPSLFMLMFSRAMFFLHAIVAELD